MPEECKKPGCRSYRAQGFDYCLNHAAMMFARKKPSNGHASPGSRLAFLKSALKADTDECILFPFADASVAWLGKPRRASRLMCLLAHKLPESEDMMALHKCGNGHLMCVNPRHLYWGTAKDNAADAQHHAEFGKQDADPLEEHHKDAARMKSRNPGDRQTRNRARRMIEAMKRAELKMAPSREDSFSNSAS